MGRIAAAKDKVFARLDRARDLYRILDKTITSHPNFDLGTQKTYSSETGRTELRLVIPPMPQEWGFLASEILHHTRASLDNSLVAVAENRSVYPAPGWKPSFPLALNDEDFNKYSIKRNLRGVDPQLIELVRRNQPFSFVGELPASLCSLADLNNADKHSALAVVGTVFAEALHVDEIEVAFTSEYKGAGLRYHSTPAGKIADGHILISVETNFPHQEAHFYSVKFKNHNLKFDTVIEALPEFSIDDFLLAIKDAESVCKVLFEFA